MKSSLSNLMLKVLNAYYKCISFLKGFLPISDSKIENKEVETPSSDLKINEKDIIEFIGDFIGVISTGFDTYVDDVEDYENKISGKLLSKVEIDNTILKLHFSNPNGTYAGVLELHLTISAQISERHETDIPFDTSKYRIKFFGGDCLEYMDKEKTTIAAYHIG